MWSDSIKDAVFCVCKMTAFGITVFSRFNAGPRINAGSWRGSCRYTPQDVIYGINQRYKRQDTRLSRKRHKNFSLVTVSPNKLQIQRDTGLQGQVWIKRRGRLIDKHDFVQTSNPTKVKISSDMGSFLARYCPFIDRFLQFIESPHYFLSLVTVSAFETCVLRLNVIQPTDHHIHRPSNKRSGSKRRMESQYIRCLQEDKAYFSFSSRVVCPDRRANLKMTFTLL